MIEKIKEICYNAPDWVQGIKPSINIYEIQDCFLFIFVIVILCAI